MSNTHRCPVCGGDGKETCTNQDHGFISMVGGSIVGREIGRLGCPCCGHDEKHKVKNGGNCEYCDGVGTMSELRCNEIIEELKIDEYIIMYELFDKSTDQP